MKETLELLMFIVKETKKMKTSRYLLFWSTACIAIVLYKAADIMASVPAFVAALK